MSPQQKLPNLYTKFDFKKNEWWKIGLQILALTIIIYGIETIDYFYVAEWFGKGIFGKENTLNLQLPVDKVMPWFTPLFPYYIVWPFVWFLVLPIAIYFSSGKHMFYRYCVNALIVYLISMVIYAIIPTTCEPAQFMPGSDGTLYNQGYKSWDWAVNQPFQTTLTSLAHNPDNIWGSAPSFHNYWAATFVFFALRKNVRWCWRTPMLVLGTLISISTLVLHQHNLADIAITYTMLGLVLIWQNYRNFDLRFEQWWDKLFKVK